MTDAPEGRRPLVRTAGDAHVWSYLQPVIDAERSWGNKPQGDFELDRNGWWSMHFPEPLHVGRLRDTFSFPEGVELHDAGPRTSVVDAVNEVSLDGTRRHGYRPAATASGYEKDDSRLSKFVRRLGGVKEEDR
jgi:hypothetical protein